MTDRYGTGGWHSCPKDRCVVVGGGDRHCDGGGAGSEGGTAVSNQYPDNTVGSIACIQVKTGDQFE